jgi:hypothetical protein
MPLAADEIRRSLNGTWQLLNRRPDGLNKFDCSLSGFVGSFAAILVAAPPFIAVLAAERLERGLAEPNAGLFDDPALALATAAAFFAAWITLPALAFGLSRILQIKYRLVPFVVAINWSSVLASFFFGLPAALYALGLATENLASVYLFAFAIIIAQMRWFIAKTALAVSSEVAAALIAIDFAIEWLAHQALRLIA